MLHTLSDGRNSQDAMMQVLPTSNVDKEYGTHFLEPLVPLVNSSKDVSSGPESSLLPADGSGTLVP